MNIWIFSNFTIALLAFASSPVLAQSKFFSTPSRGGADGAKQSAQITTFQNEFQRMNTCTADGLVYAPTHVASDPNGCTSDVSARSLSDDLSVSGHISVSGTLSVLGTLKVAGEGEPCVPTLAGAIRYLSAAQVIEYCDGTAWTGLGSAGEATSMIAGWPDALLCTTAGPVQRIYYFQHILSDGRRTYRTDGGGSTYGVIFNSSQTFSSHEGVATTNCNMSIDAIKTAGRAFNFIGGSGSGGGGSAGNPQLVEDAGACTMAKEGALRWNSGDKLVEFCNGSAWAELGVGSDFDLVNGLHASSQCTAIGGEVVTVTGNVKVCRFSDYQCPSGWIQYQNWSETIQHHANPNCGASCWTTAVAWSNTVKVACSCPAMGVCGPCEAMGAWHNPAIRKIGCYYPLLATA